MVSEVGSAIIGPRDTLGTWDPIRPRDLIDSYRQGRRSWGGQGGPDPPPPENMKGGQGML